MNNQVAIRKGTTAPAHPTLFLSQLTQRLGTKLTEVNFRKYELSSRDAPTKEQRHELISRRQLLDGALAPALPKECKAVVIRIIFSFRPDMSQDDMEALAKNYMEAVSTMPFWALEKARQMVMKGEDTREKKSFMPTPPEFTMTVESLVKPVRIEHSTIHRILEAEVVPEPTDEQRARGAELVRKLAESFGKRIEENERAEKEEEFRKREAIEEAARQAAEVAAARQAKISPSSQPEERSSSPETH